MGQANGSLMSSTIERSKLLINSFLVIHSAVDYTPKVHFTISPNVAFFRENQIIHNTGCDSNTVIPLIN